MADVGRMWENQSGAEVPIADGCGVERGGGLGQGEGEHAQRKERPQEGRVSMGQLWTTAEGGGELFREPEGGQVLLHLAGGQLCGEQAGLA